MAMTNAQHQARWREKHLRVRRQADRVRNLLVKKQITDDDIHEIATLLNIIFERDNVRALRRWLKELSEPSKNQRNAGYYQRTRTRIQGVIDTMADIETERPAWETDFPGKEYPAPLDCALGEPENDRASADLWRWRRQRARKAMREAKKQANNKPG
jgi:hypothetical protein